MKIAFAVIMVFALAACSQTQPGGTSLASATAQAAGESTSGAEAPASSASTPLPASTTIAPAADATLVLTQYHWRLVNAVDKSGRRIDALFARPDKPLQLDFDANDVSVSNTCNRMRGNYSIAGGKLTFGNFASTLMACNNPALAALDAAAGKTLQGTFALSVEVRGKQPRLTLSIAGGNTLTFAGTPTDTTRYGGEGETQFLEVAPQTRPCPVPPGSQCLYVRELHYGANGVRAGRPGDWHVLAQDIQGYTHQHGTRNVLRVKRYRISNPPADASSTAYVLDMVVETELPPRSS